MRAFLLLIAAVGLLGLTACSKTRFSTYNGPEVTRIVVVKNIRKMYLLHQDELIATYDIDLGFAPEGAKAHEGDGRTPEGRYHIDRVNPNSAFHLSLGISYPNDQDRARAAAAGKSPGGDIFIHGDRRAHDPDGKDWTAGCISVSDKEVEQIYAMVRLGTIIDIFP